MALMSLGSSDADEGAIEEDKPRFLREVRRDSVASGAGEVFLDPLLDPKLR